MAMLNNQRVNLIVGKGQGFSEQNLGGRLPPATPKKTLPAQVQWLQSGKSEKWRLGSSFASLPLLSEMFENWDTSKIYQNGELESATGSNIFNAPVLFRFFPGSTLQLDIVAQDLPHVFTSCSHPNCWLFHSLCSIWCWDSFQIDTETPGSTEDMYQTFTFW